MTDRQVTESTIGLAGRLSHLPYSLGKAEDRGWLSTRNFAQTTPAFKELGPNKTWSLTPGTTSEQSLGSSASTAWQTSKKQQKWLLKTHPEARLGNECIHDQLISSRSSPQPHSGELWSSSLLAIGELTDTSEPRRVSGAPLVAITTGKANDVLRLMKPNIEEWQWADDDSVSLRLAGMTDEDESTLFKEDFAGPIRCLKTVVNSKRYDPTRWVIVQRDSGTRVFQPEYRRAPTISAYADKGEASRIAANSLFFLSKDRTGGNPHSDVSFNPGERSRPQLGVIDECGFWSIWDISHTKIRSSGKAKVSLKKCGHIGKGVLSHLPSKGIGEVQWHKLLWVGCPSEESQAFDLEEDADELESQGSFPQLVRSSTLLLCSPKLVRLLDLSNDSFLSDLPLVGAGSRDHVLDVHENPRDSQYVFILTTSKLFVIRIYSAPGQDWGEARKQWTIVLAISHLRNGFDWRLKLTVAPGIVSSGRATSLVYIYSNSNTRIDLFCITMCKSDPSRVAYHSENITLDAFQHASSGMALRTMCFHPASVAMKPSNMPTQFARGLSRQNIRFYQLAALRTDMCFVSTLCVVTSTSSIGQIDRPVYKVSRARDPYKERRRIIKHIGTSFVIPDDASMHGSGDEHDRTITKYLSHWPVTQRPIGILNEYLSTYFNDRVREYRELPTGEEGFGSNPFDDIHLIVEQAIENGTMPATTLFQMIEKTKVPGDMSLAATGWELELERLRRINPSVILLALNRPQSQVTTPTTSLQELYYTLLGMTVDASFSEEAQGWAHGARSTVLRQIACDIYLSLFGLVHHQVDLNESQQSLAFDLDRMVIDSQQGSRAGSVARSQSEVSVSSSKELNTDAPEGEDPAMTLLRSYTGTGKFVPAKRTTLLEKWEVGANPDDYAFDLDRNKEIRPGMQRRAKKLARESRKRRRAETLLQIHKDQEPTLPSTQPPPDTHFFSQRSQPLRDYSSQAVMSDPLQSMSQPMPGPFGRRDERPKKKVKKRKEGFR